ncbi:MAG: hypothetical protein JSR93_11895 [Verrucomicrobia bacterium]|nr:hypothetical protein [Verrucomicrobiota bacterium]
MWFRKFIIAALLAVFSVSVSFTSDYQIEYQYPVIEKALQLEQKGTLKQKDNGYLYVEVSRDYIAEILPLIEAPGNLVPPRHCTSKNGIGPHISVIYENELIDNEIWEIKELGQEFTFSVINLRTVKVNTDGKMKKLWLLAVSCPELENLRTHYGLSPKLKGHDFHITICTQVPGKPSISEVEIPDAA